MPGPAELERVWAGRRVSAEKSRPLGKGGSSVTSEQFKENPSLPAVVEKSTIELLDAAHAAPDGLARAGQLVAVTDFGLVALGINVASLPATLTYRCEGCSAEIRVWRDAA